MKRARTIFESFFYAISGLIYAFKTQRNIKIHFFAAAIAIALSILLNLTTLEYLAVCITITIVIVSEMINTAIETVVDLYTKKHHPLAAIAKNVAAGAVLVSAVNALVVGYLVFFRRIVELFK